MGPSSIHNKTIKMFAGEWISCGSYGLVSCEQLRDSRSPHNRGGQLEVLAEAGFVLSAWPSGKEQDSKADGEVKKSAFPSARQHRDLCYAICERTCTLSL